MSVSRSVRFCAAVFGVLIAVDPAPAADYGPSGGYDGGYKEPPGPVPLPIALWSGFYIGPSFGWSWSRIRAANNALIITNNGTVPFSHPGTNGMIGGGQIGYNVQASNFVYGIELDFGGLDIGASATKTDPNNPARVLTVRSSAGFYGDITGRAGLTVGNALLYLKGGFAYFTGNVQVTDLYDGIVQDTGIFTGWTAGGGIEYKLTRTLSLKGEYLYFGLDSSNFSCCVTLNTGTVENNITANTFRLGLNYNLNDLRSPLE